MIILNKILNYLPRSIVADQLVPFSLDFLEKEYNQVEVLQILATHEIINKLYHMNEEDQGSYEESVILEALQKHSERIIDVLTVGSKHRKRLIRQSARVLLYKYEKIHQMKNI